jgi:hypothetical protein
MMRELPREGHLIFLTSIPKSVMEITELTRNGRRMWIWYNVCV